VSQYQKGNTNMDFTEARDSEWQWHQLGHMQVSTSLQTDNHASTSSLNNATCHHTAENSRLPSRFWFSYFLHGPGSAL